MENHSVEVKDDWYSFRVAILVLVGVNFLIYVAGYIT